MEKVQYGVEEGAGSATVCVSLLGEPGGDVVVTLETVDREARGEERRGVGREARGEDRRGGR